MTELVEEPTAYLVRWWDDGRPRCRVQMGEIVEPWLDRLKPEFVPLYAPPILARQRNEGIEAAAKAAWGAPIFPVDDMTTDPVRWAAFRYGKDCAVAAIRALKEPE